MPSGCFRAKRERARLGIMQLDGAEAVPGSASWRALGYVVLLTLALWLVDLIVVAMVFTSFVVSLFSPLIANVDTVDMFGWTFDTAGEALPFALIATPISFSRRGAVVVGTHPPQPARGGA